MSWGSCIFHVFGSEFDPDALLDGSSLTPYSVYRRGEPKSALPSRADQMWERSGLTFDVSDGETLAVQAVDAIVFLQTHNESLKRLASLPAIDGRWLDFGYQCRIGVNVAVQCDQLPHELLRLAGELKIGIELTLYPSGFGEGEEE